MRTSKLSAQATRGADGVHVYHVVRVCGTAVCRKSAEWRGVE